MVNEGLTAEAMQELNARVDLDKKTPEEVAGEYLSEDGARPVGASTSAPGTGGPMPSVPAAAPACAPSRRRAASCRACRA